MTGMRVVEAVSGEPGVKPTAFLSADGRTLIVHVVNAQDKDASITLGAIGGYPSAVRRRTSATEDDAELSPLARGSAGFSDTLPARSMVTYRLERK